MSSDRPREPHMEMNTPFIAQPPMGESAPLVRETSALRPSPRPRPAPYPQTREENAVYVPPETNEETLPPVANTLVNSETITVLGNAAAARFLTRENLKGSATKLLHQQQGPDGTGLILSANFTNRRLERTGNLQLPPDDCPVIDAGIFGPGGVVESLPPEHAAAALAAATAYGNPETTTMYQNILRSVIDALSVTHEYFDADRNMVVTYPVRPDVRKICDGVQMWDQARFDETDPSNPEEDKHYPEYPETLDDGEIARLTIALNTARKWDIPATRAHITQLRARLENDVCPKPGAYDPTPEEDTPYNDTSRAVIPLEEDEIDMTPAQVSRMSVDKTAKGERLDAQARALGSAVLSAITLADGTKIKKLVLENVDELLNRAPELLREIRNGCRKASPPIPYVMTTSDVGTGDTSLPIVAGDVFLCGPVPMDQARGISGLLMPTPHEDRVSYNHTRGSSDGTTIGQTRNKGYDPETTKVSGGVSTANGAARSVTDSESETVNVVVRTPYAYEIAALGKWEVAHFGPEGDLKGVYDLSQEGGPLVRMTLTPMADATTPRLSATANIDRVQAAIDQERQQHTQGRTGRGEGLPAMPPAPAPPVSKRQPTPASTVRSGSRFYEISMQNGGRGKMTPEILSTAGIAEWRRQSGNQRLDENSYKEWLQWCADSGGGGALANTAWRMHLEDRGIRMDRRRR